MPNLKIFTLVTAESEREQNKEQSHANASDFGDFLLNKQPYNHSFKIIAGLCHGHELPPSIYDKLLLPCDRHQGGHMTSED